MEVLGTPDGSKRPPVAADASAKPRVQERSTGRVFLARQAPGDSTPRPLAAIGVRPSRFIHAQRPLARTRRKGL